jgi:glutathione S-transferase
MKLYYAPRTRAVRPRWLLEELGVPYELVRLDLHKGEHKTPEYMKIHPHGVVPALVDGDLALFESAALCMYLADQFPEKKLAPPVGTRARALYYQWMAYALGTLEEALEKIIMHSTGLPEARRKPELVAEGQESLASVAQVLTPVLAGKQFLLGEQFTAADVVLGSGMVWMRMMGHLKGFPEVEAYADRLGARPAFQRANKD